jgi:hypothetical protein
VIASFGDIRLPERFWAKVNNCPISGCWLWAGAIGGRGYGMSWNVRISDYAHRMTFLALAGEIAKGLELDHLCRVRSCCNPAHLEPVTRLENVRRGMAGDHRRITCANMTHCKNGHARSEHAKANSAGHVRCKACQYANDHNPARVERRNRKRREDRKLAQTARAA